MRVQFRTPDIETLREKHMLVDMHFHSKYSHDSSTPIGAIIERAKQLGVHVALTDHNTITGVLAAQRLAPGIVKPGIEVTTKEGKDILVYFYTTDDLEIFFERHVKHRVRNKSSMRSTRTSIRSDELLDMLARERCVTALAHPFAVGPRQSYQFFRRRPHLLDGVHAMEVVNQAVPHRRNLASVGWCAQCDKSVLGGSDGHIASMLGSAFTACEASTWEGFLDAIVRKRALVVGEERKLRHHVMNMARVLREKSRILENRRIKKENS